MPDKKKINQLQLLQQNLQNLELQKQQFQNQLIEIDSALTELKSTEKAYKIVGKIMLAASKDELSKDLSEKKETVGVRLKNLTKQEDALQKAIEQLQQEIMAELGKEKS
ncbi:MAG TPA: prefoldin subunit beta [Candidatus Nanoarchaeia archaeon]|nr:prefoldin subunit beta [Candidatus Nanoarchaeia archaeon]